MDEAVLYENQKTMYKLREMFGLFFVSVSRIFMENFGASTRVVSRATYFRGFSGGPISRSAAVVGRGFTRIDNRFSDRSRTEVTPK